MLTGAASSRRLRSGGILKRVVGAPASLVQLRRYYGKSKSIGLPVPRPVNMLMARQYGAPDIHLHRAGDLRGLGRLTLACHFVLDAH